MGWWCTGTRRCPAAPPGCEGGAPVSGDLGAVCLYPDAVIMVSTLAVTRAGKDEEEEGELGKEGP